MTQKDVLREVTLHRHCAPHPNVLEWINTGEDAYFYWIAMELAEGGDLFDKIEPDVGLGEDAAHFYFTQLISGIGFIHSKGVAHRDIKPENIMLDADGNLKIGDFGLAALFRNPADGSVRHCTTSCGSPPYIAPEVIGHKYAANKADIWSCGIVLFVLCCGITPWAAPLDDDPDFAHYVRAAGRVADKIWDKVPLGALSLLRSMLKLDPTQRYDIDNVRGHPWFTRANNLIANDGTCSSPLELAAELLGKMHIDINNKASKSDSTPGGGDIFSGSQPVHAGTSHLEFSDMPMVFSQQEGLYGSSNQDVILDIIAQDPGQLQFLRNRGIPETMSQRASRFKDLIPFARFTRFFSQLEFEQLVPLLVSALRQNRILVPTIDYMAAAHKREPEVSITTTDRKGMALRGKVSLSYASNTVLEVNFAKTLGDPLEWRQLFKRIVMALPANTIYTPFQDS